YPMTLPPLRIVESMDTRQIRLLAAQSANFGFLEPHQSLLVWYGAGAEALVYVDAQSAIFKARHFGETLAKELAQRTGTPVADTRFVGYIAPFDTAGFLPANIHDAFERLRHCCQRRSAARSIRDITGSKSRSPRQRSRGRAARWPSRCSTPGRTFPATS